ncbi:hypothetical protein WR25_10865 isoform B [Diploscapter pachys]|uniref:Uncharacterized protein n=1 Tax=Diploscapter pachys TaxID=2018661 RepID=A0A2A2LZU6_9BILA|nr:hypothetical protein WR25_10865 isoform B [Diploscapter pachys]
MKISIFSDLSSCSLMYIADAIYLVLKGYDNIDKISLRNNDLKKCPKKIFDRFPETKIFNIESNKISEIPDELSTCTSLKGLNAANNLLTAFAESIYSLENLLILDLSGNQIVGRSFIQLDWQFMLIFSKRSYGFGKKLRIFSTLDMKLRFVLFLISKQFMLSEIDVDRLYENCSKLAKLNLSKNPLSDEVRQKLESSPKKPENLRLTL